MILAVFGVPMDLPRTDAALRDAHSASAEMRWIAAMALGREDGPGRAQAVEALAALTVELNEDVRAQAIEGLAAQARSGARVAAAGAERWIEDSSDLVRCAALSNGDAFEFDVEALAARMIADESPAARATAAHVLGLRGASVHADEIAGLLDDPSRAVREEAALALARFGDERGAELASAMLDAGGEEAVEAATALGQSGRPIAARALRGLLDRRFVPVELKAAAAAALSRGGDRAGRAAIAAMLGSWRRRTRFAAAHALAALPSSGVAEAVGARVGKVEALEASVLVQTLAAIGEEAPEEALAALRRAAEDAALTSEIKEELLDAIRALATLGG